MRTLILAAAVVLCCANSAPAEENAPAASPLNGRKVAVLDLAPQGVPEGTAATLTGVFLSGLAEGGQIELIGKSDLARILNLEEMQALLGCPPEDPRCMADHARALSGGVLVWGSVGRVGDRIVVSAAAVDVEKAAAIGRASHSASIEKGEEQIQAVLDVAAEIRAALGLSSRAAFSPIMAALLLAGVSASDYSEGAGDLESFNFMLQAELNVFLREWLLLFLQVGTRMGFNGRTEGSQTEPGKAFEAWFLPVTAGAKVRFVRPWLTPFLGLGVGVSLLKLNELAGAVNVNLIAGLELNPWQRFGFVVQGAMVFSQFFAAGSQNFLQLGGEVGLGAVYRF